MHIDGQRTVSCRPQILVLGTNRITIDFVWGKEMMLVIERQRPKPSCRRKSLYKALRCRPSQIISGDSTAAPEVVCNHQSDVLAMLPTDNSLGNVWLGA